MAKRRKSYPPIESMGMEGFGIAIADALPNVDELKSLLILSGTTGIAFLGSRILFSKVPFLGSLHWGLKVAVKAALGAVAGKFVSNRFNQLAGTGLAVGFWGSALIDDVLPMLPIPGLAGLNGSMGQLGSGDDVELFGDVSVHERPYEEYAYNGLEIVDQPDYIPA